MKTGRFLIPVVAACVAVFAACGEKDNDYRDVWVGTYEGCSEYHNSTGTDYQVYTVFAGESLTVCKKGDHQLEVLYLGLEFPVDCTPEGVFSSTTGNPHSEWEGSIKGDSLFFIYHDVSQGHSISWLFKGKKTK